MNILLKTLAHWNISLQGNFERDTQSDAFRIIAGNKEEYVTGLKTVLVVANLNEILLGGKNEDIVGLETKYVRPRLSENFVGMKNSGTIAVTFESNSGDKNKFAPTTSARNQTGATAVCPDVKDIVGNAKQKYEQLVARGAKLTQKIEALSLKATSIKTQASELNATISTFDGQYGNVVWKADAWTEACSGAYNIEAASWDAASKGAVEIKGSTVMVQYWTSPKIECAGGKVKIGRHLVVE